MPVSDNYKKYGTVDVEYANITGTSIKLNCTLGYTTIGNKTTMGGMYAENRGNDEFNINIDETYGYCAADKDFGMNKITVITGQRGGSYGGFAINNNKKFDYVAENQVPIGFMTLADYSSYAYPGFTRGRDADTTYGENVVINSYSVKYPYNYSSTYNECRIYGADIKPIIGNLNFKDVIAIPIVRAYGAKNGEDNLATTEPTEIGNKFNSILCDLESYKRHYHTTYPWISTVMIEHYPLYFDDNHQQIYVNTSKRILPFISTGFRTNIYVNTTEEKEIDYKILFGDDGSSASTSSGIYRWNEQTQSVEEKAWTWHGIVMLGIQKFRTAYTKTNAGNANDGFIVTTGDLLQCDYTTVGADHYVKVYSANLSSDEAVETAYNYIMKQCAYLGCFFKPAAYLENIDYRFIDDNTYMGVIDGSGITHGEYTRGLENAKNLQYDWKDAVNDTTFKPGGGGGGPTSGGDKDREKSTYSGKKFSTHSANVGEFGVSRYIITSDQFADFNKYVAECMDYDAARTAFIADLVSKGVAQDLALELWTDRFKDEAAYITSIFNKLGYGSDPRNSIISLMYFPVLSSDQFSDTDNFYIGNGYYVGKELKAKIPSGAGTFHEVTYAPQSDFNTVVNIPAWTVETYSYVKNYLIKHPNDWDDFRAYEPYSRAELYVPYHGNIALNLNDCLGKHLSIDLCYDIVTGGSIATIMVDDCIYATIPGQMGFQLPFSVDASSINSAGLMTLSSQSQSTKLNAVGNLVNGAMSIASGIAGGNYLGAVSGTINTIIGSKQNQIQEKSLEYQIQHACDGRVICNSSGGLVNISQDDTPQIVWHYPLMLAYNDTNYAHTVGYACTRSGSVGSFKGYTVFTNVDLANVSATEQEKAMILAQLQNGIII